jgi:survival-of-motor-neuron-related-splicing factor 30
VDTTLVQKKEPSKVSDGPTRLAPEPKKLKGNRVLEKGKSNWQDFQKVGPKKGAAGGSKLGKDSQFRTPDNPNARVGFTGSGKPMQKDQARTTWKYGGGGQPED